MAGSEITLADLMRLSPDKGKKVWATLSDDVKRGLRLIAEYDDMRAEDAWVAAMHQAKALGVASWKAARQERLTVNTTILRLDWFDGIQSILWRMSLARSVADVGADPKANSLYSRTERVRRVLATIERLGWPELDISAALSRERAVHDREQLQLPVTKQRSFGITASTLVLAAGEANWRSNLAWLPNDWACLPDLVEQTLQSLEKQAA